MRTLIALLCILLAGCTMIDYETLDTADDKPGQPATGWSASGNLFLGNRSAQVPLQAVFDSPQDYTIQFSIQTPALPSPLPVDVPVLNATALITWSVKGNSVVRKISISNGMSITGTGQGVRVVMQDESDASSIDGLPYTVSAQVAKGSRATNGTPPVLTYIAPGTGPLIVTAPNTTTLIAVPQNVGITAIFVSAVQLAGLAIANPPTVLITSEVTPLKGYNPLVFADWVPIGPNAAVVELINNDASVEIAFAIDFGIDG